MQLSIVIPSYNEAPILTQTLTRLHEAFPEAELVLVSDGCVDDTEHVCRRLPFPVRYIGYQPNRGKGHAVRRGMLAATGDIAVFTDADLPFGTEGVERVVAALEQRADAQIAIGQKQGEQKDLLYRFLRAGVRLVVRAVTGLGFGDTQAGLKAFRRSAARLIYTRTFIDRFATDIEVLYLARRYGLAVTEVPLTVGETLRPSSFNSRQGMLLFLDVWRIRRHRYR